MTLKGPVKMRASHRILQLSSWVVLFSIQVYFNLNPVHDEWIRIIILSSYMLLVSVSLIKFLEKKPLTKWLNINERTIVVFTCSLSASIFVLFTKREFPTAALIAGGSMLLPVLEELYFRAFLLGSVSFGWPNVKTIPRENRRLYFREGLVYLVLTSLGFALVHDDVIRSVLVSNLYGLNLTMFFLRFLFGLTMGGLYFYTRNFMITTAFHVVYNMTYIIASF